MKKMDDKIRAIIYKIIPSAESEIPLLSSHLSKLDVYEKSKGEWYIKSHDVDGKEKLIFNENKNQRWPEEIVRQLFLFELTDNYGYPINKIKTEELVNFGREKKRADIVVYQDDGITPWIIVEVKEPNERLNIPQLKSYLNAQGSPIGVAVNGKEITILYRPYPKEFEDNLPDIPTYPEYTEVKDSTNPAIEVSEIVLSRNWTLEKLKEANKQKKRPLRDIIETLEELVLANSGVDSFNEVFKLIYAKLYDEYEAQNRKDHQLKFRKYKEPQVTYREIADLFNGAKEEWKGIFEKTEEIKLKPDHLNICVGEMQEMELFGADLRIIDEAFEYLVPEVAKSDKGQYFTPRVIIDAAVRMLNPGRKEYVIDPACGSSGFLVHTMKYIWKKCNMKNKDVKSAYAGRYLWGIDFEEKATKIARALMLIAGDGKAHIYQENSLEFTRWSEGFKSDLKKEELVRDEGFKELNFDILLTNPPFAGEILEKWLKALYSDILPEKKVKSDSSVDRHILFIQRALDMIKPGGRLAIVLPQGVFNNTNDKYIREFIMRKARILAVVGLHGNSFKPHTGTKTSLLFLRKWKDDEPFKEDYPIFFAVSKIPMKDNSGNYVFVKDENGNMTFDEEGSPVFQTDLFDIADAFIKWGKEQLNKGDEDFDFLEDYRN
jgi:type I restriction enzyme M protein